jgi:hypothetical protein
MVTVVAGARTPWAPRSGVLGGVHPEHLLTSAIGAAAERAGLEPSDCALLLVACDSQIGAQAANVARRAVIGLGAASVPALTVDGQGISDMALVGMVSAATGPVVVAAVDSTSTVPPGAALVRDYGRPSAVESTETALLEGAARAHDISRADLDSASSSMRSAFSSRSDPTRQLPDLVTVPVGSSVVDSDVMAEVEPSPGLLPLVEGGITTAAHQARLADGAAAVVLHREKGHRVESVDSVATDPERVVDAVIEMCSSAPAPVLLVDASLVIHEVVRRSGADLFRGGVVPCPLIGSAPSADGLRALVDCLGASDSAFSIVRRGRAGQVVRLTMGAR